MKPSPIRAATSSAGAGPVIAEDVLVERLAGAHAERETAAEQLLRRRGGLCDHRGVDPRRRAGDGGRDAQPVGRGCDAAQHGPDERAVTLIIEPGVEVVGDPRGGEAGALGEDGGLDELAARMFLGGQEVADRRHGVGLPGRQTR